MPVVQYNHQGHNSLTIVRKCQNNNDIYSDIIPIFQRGSTPESLLGQGIFVEINIQSKSPLMNLTGGKKLVDFLANLPSPSIMILTDTLNRHKAKAFAKMKKGESISDEKALDTAMKAGKYLF